MIERLNKIVTLRGQSGKEYTFELYGFGDFDDLKSMDKEMPVLYLFSQRYANNGAYLHNYLYLGETGDLSTRFSGHHKEAELRQHNANCIGLCTQVPEDDTSRKALEEDLLGAIKFPLNVADY